MKVNLQREHKVDFWCLKAMLNVNLILYLSTVVHRNVISIHKISGNANFA